MSHSGKVDRVNQCIEQLDVAGSPWHAVCELIADRLAYRIKLQGFTHEQLILVSKFVSEEFIHKHKLYESLGKGSNTLVHHSTRKFTESYAQELLKDLTLKAARDAECMWPNDSSSPPCFSDLVNLTKDIWQSKGIGRRKDADSLALSLVKILQNDPSKLNDVVSKLKGRPLPRNLQNYIYRFLLLKKRKKLASDERKGATVADDDLTQQQIREVFASSVRKGMLGFKSKQPTNTPVAHLIQSSVLETFEAMPSPSGTNVDNLILQQEACRVLNILYTHSNNFESFYVLWFLPLHMALTNDKKDKQQDYELAMWLDMVITTCIPSWSLVIEITLSVWSEVAGLTSSSSAFRNFALYEYFLTLDVNLDQAKVKETIQQLFGRGQSGSYKRLLKNLYTTQSLGSLHPALCICNWISCLFVNTTNLKVTMYIWDQLFMHNWSPSCLKHVCLCLVYCVSTEILKCEEKQELVELLTKGITQITVSQIAKAWVLLK